MSSQDRHFSKWSLEWLEFHRSAIKYGSYEMYEAKVRKINMQFGTSEVEDINSIDIQKYLNKLADVNNFSKSTVKKYRLTLSQIFYYCIINKAAAINPCKLVEIPKIMKRQARRTLTDAEIDVITQNVDNDGLYPFMLLYTGLRRSECLALCWEDIDFKKDIIHIYKACIFNKNIPHIDYELKNGDNERYIPMPTLLKSALLHHKQKKGLIFGDANKLFTKSQADAMFNQYLKNNNLNFTQHMTRHAYATMLYNAGVDVRAAQKILGHKCFSVTMEIYTHLDQQHWEISASKLNTYLMNNAQK